MGEGVGASDWSRDKGRIANYKIKRAIFLFLDEIPGSSFGKGFRIGVWLIVLAGTFVPDFFVDHFSGFGSNLFAVGAIGGNRHNA